MHTVSFPNQRNSSMFLIIKGSLLCGGDLGSFGPELRPSGLDGESIEPLKIRSPAMLRVNGTAQNSAALGDSSEVETTAFRMLRSVCRGGRYSIRWDAGFPS